MTANFSNTVKKWDVFEISSAGKTEGNPFTDYTIGGTFTNGIETVSVCGFYDGEGIIVMHPYDRWGFCMMDKEADALYWKYVVNRFAAYRNVWWSLENEYDLFPTKTLEDWEMFAYIIRKHEPYHHPRSIHNCTPIMTTRDLGLPIAAFSVLTSIRPPSGLQIGAFATKNRSLWTKSPMRAISSTAGATSPARRWFAASGRPSSGAAIPDTARAGSA